MSTSPARAQKEYHQKLIEKLNLWIAETKEEKKWIEDKERRIKDRKVKAGKKKYEKINIGDVAFKLAKDIVYLTPFENNEGITAPNFNRLQEHFALWLEKDRRLKAIAIIKAFNIFEKHPFLAQLNNIESYSSIIELYKKYLSEKIVFLESKKNTQLKEHIFINNKEIKKREDFENYSVNLAKELLGLPINLPRNMFLEEIKKQESIKEHYNRPNRINVTYLIQSYLKNNLKDSYQEFFNYDRKYKFFEKTVRDNFQKEKNIYQELLYNDKKIERIKDIIKKDNNNINFKFYKQFVENEKSLRLVRTQDIMLFLIAKNILINTKDRNTQFESIKLKDVGIGKRILETQTNVELSIFINEFEFIITDKLKIKNYGDFKHFLFDKRVYGFLQCLSKINIINKRDKFSITRKEIEKELEKYEEFRLMVFEKVLDFEKACLTPPAFVNLERNSYGCIPFHDIIKSFSEKVGEGKVDLNFIKNIRNDFAHSQYLELSKEIINWMPKMNQENILDYIFNDFSNSIEECKKLISN